MSNDTEKSPHAEVPVWGCKAIAKLIGKSERATFHLLEQRALPAEKIAGQWAALPSRLRAEIHR